ncbi:MAG: hypothetical protein LC748_09095 [Thermomicrobia bacterium]|nr:hypothetical protein [Thermomicrobia bacterium]
MGKAWTQSDEDRALIAYVRAVILAEPLQLAILEKHGVRLAGLRALRVLRDLGTVPISRSRAPSASVSARSPRKSRACSPIC